MSPLPRRVFPVPYQVDFSVESKGRHIDSTKRKIAWKFGFAHPPAVFPHLFDANENHIDDNNGDSGGAIVPAADPKRGVECRGREHEIVLTWSILTGKAHIYVDSREIYRHEPVEDSIFNPFSASFHRGFNLPNPKFNGRHRIDIRCYARTPMGAKNMVVDDRGGKFRQYDLNVDGLSYFTMPPVFELGTERMWNKVGRWGLNRVQYQEEVIPFGGGVHGEHYDKYGRSISKNEYKAMNPRSDSEEERMMRIAMDASLNDWERDVGHGKRNNGGAASRSSSSEENDSSYSNGRKGTSRSAAKKKSAKKMSSIGEDNLIDFGADEASKALSQITISRQTSSGISVMDNDDATTASFVMGTAWNSNDMAPPSRQQYSSFSPRHPTAAHLYPNQQPQLPPHQYHDPTFRSPHAQQQWTGVGTVSSPNHTSPHNGASLPSDASFAVPPPPTWDDYNDAFGGSTMDSMDASVAVGSTATTYAQPMSPASAASVGMMSPMTQVRQQPLMNAQYGTQQASQWQSQPLSPAGGGSIFGGGPSMGASHGVSNGNKFDPLRADPFAS